MSETLSKKFLETYEVIDLVNLLYFLTNKNLYNIGFEICNHFSSYYENIKFLYYYALCSFKVNNYKLAYDICIKSLNIKYLQTEDFELLIKLKRFIIDKIKDTNVNYDLNKVKDIQKIVRENNNLPLITFSITTCKRIDLFKDTMNSFINCCEDIKLISKWICIDDNSSQKDREEMINLYPFLTFYFKNKNEKGHSKSMNILKELVTTPYLFHMEDDWKFFEKRNYITECLQVLSENKNFGQCLINKNYAEIPDTEILGGELKFTSNGLRYYIHEYAYDDVLKDKWNKKHGFGLHCNYWPHFSFRPSLLKTKIFKNIGDFNEKASHFEMEYSYRYFAKNYISTFLEDMYCIHIGRLTSERDDKTKINAYILNDEIQFENKKIIDLNYETYVVNLDHRQDRLRDFDKIISETSLKYERFPAINGNNIVSTPKLQYIFEGNDFYMASGMVGCALSHIKLWIDLINSDKDVYLIFEDDITYIVPNFKEKLIHLHSKFKNIDWDIVYLGHHEQHMFFKEEITDFEKNTYPNIEKWRVEETFYKSIGGTFGYFISKTGAIKLLDFIEKTGITNGIDTMMQKFCDVGNVYYSIPNLIRSYCFRGHNRDKVDSDIQFASKFLQLNCVHRLNTEIEYYKNIGEVIIEKDNIEIQLIQSDIDNNIYFKNLNEEQKSFVKSNCLHSYCFIGNHVIIFKEKQKNRFQYRIKKDDKFYIEDVLN
jgi:GR25 family glycosyltransferase involved in LPS biosynthesis